MARARYDQGAGQAADRAGEAHGADDDVFDIDARVSGCIRTLTDDGELVAVLGIIHVEGDQDGHDKHDQDGKAVFRTENPGEPAALGLGVDDADGIGTLGIFPF